MTIKQQQIDVLIVGAGIAGCSLAYALHQEGFKVQLLDNFKQQSATSISNGLIQRISGQKLGINSIVNDCFDEAVAYYKRLQHTGVQSIIRPLAVTKYLDKDQQKLWEKKRFQTRYQGLMGTCLKPHNERLSGVELFGNYLVDPVAYLACMKAFFVEHNMMVHDVFNESGLSVNSQYVRYKSWQAQYIVYCMGYSIKESVCFCKLTYQNIKGEVLTLDAPDLTFQGCLQQKHSLTALGKGRYKFGSTYSKSLGVLPNKRGYEELLDALKGMVDRRFSVTTIQAGVRCALHDQKPVLGWARSLDRVGVFSGFGSRGLITAPVLAMRWGAQFPEIPPSCLSMSVNRFEVLNSR